MENNSLYSLVFDAIRDPLLLVDADGIIRVANASACVAFRIGESRALVDLVVADDRLAVDGADIARLAEQHEVLHDYQIAEGAGVSLDIEPVRGPNGALLRLIHVRGGAPDAKRHFWKDEMISMVSHEIKNPLSAMKHSVDILLSQMPGGLTAGQRRFLDTSGRSIDRLTHMLDGFLDVSRIHSGAFEIERGPVDLREFLGNAVESFRTLFNVRRVDLSWGVEGAAPGAFIDSGKLEQVLINLLSNALKFTPEGGRIRVTARAVGVEAVRDDVRLLPWDEIGAPKLLEIDVRDTGLGMSSDTLGGVFDRYQSEHPEAAGIARGTHLGLNISRSLIEAQGGRLVIQSELGIGTTVKVLLPQDRHTHCVLSRIESMSRLLRRHEATKQRSTVLVVGKYNDDNWTDICRSWYRTPAINVTQRNETHDGFYLWTLSNELAVAVVADPDSGDEVGQYVSSRHIQRDAHSYVFSSWAIGAAELPAEADGMVQAIGIATSRMSRARDVMARTSIEKSDTGIECLTNEWGQGS